MSEQDELVSNGKGHSYHYRDDIINAGMHGRHVCTSREITPEAQGTNTGSGTLDHHYIFESNCKGEKCVHSGQYLKDFTWQITLMNTLEEEI